MSYLVWESLLSFTKYSKPWILTFTILPTLIHQWCITNVVFTSWMIWRIQCWPNIRGDNFRELMRLQWPCPRDFDPPGFFVNIGTSQLNWYISRKVRLKTLFPLRIYCSENPLLLRLINIIFQAKPTFRSDCSCSLGVKNPSNGMSLRAILNYITVFPCEKN